MSKKPIPYQLTNAELRRVSKHIIIACVGSYLRGRPISVCLGYDVLPPDAMESMLDRQTRVWRDHYLDTDELLKCVVDVTTTRRNVFHLLIVPIYIGQGMPTLRLRVIRRAPESPTFTMHD